MAGSELTCGERIVRCYLGEEIDRLPFGVGLGWVPWAETLERWKTESGDPNLNPADTLDFDLSFAIPRLESGIYPHFDFQIIEETDEMVTWRDQRGITQRNRRDAGSIPEYLDYPVKTPDDWFRLKQERLRIDEPSRILEDWEGFRERIRSTGEAVQVGQFPYGVFGTVRDLMGVEEMLVAFYTWPDMIRDMMQHLTSLWITLWEKVSAEVQIDHIHIWEDMSGRHGSLISPAMVEDFMMPCYDRIVAFARGAGARIVSVDTDGDCRELVPVMMKHGVNMFLPFEVQAGNDILEYRRLYPALGIYGGLDKRALAAGREAVDREVEKAERMMGMGRYVPAFDHLIPPDVPWDSFCYAATRIRDICYATRQGG